MERFARYEVATEAIGDFILQVANQEMTATISGFNHREEIVVNVFYEDGETDKIEFLDGYLADLIFEQIFWASKGKKVIKDFEGEV